MSMFSKRPSEAALASEFATRTVSHLKGGLTFQRTIDLIARDETELRDIATRIAGRIRSGKEPGEAIAAEAGESWRVLGTAWQIASDSGAPAADSLDRMSRALAHLEQLQRRRNVLLASPISSMVLICALPALTTFLAELIGLRVLDQFLTPLGAILLVVGLLFLLLGVTWGTAMIRSVARQDRIGGFELDLMWISVTSGSSTQYAARRVVDTASTYRARWVNLDGFVRGGSVEQVLQVARQTGVPIRDMLTTRADTLRDETFASLERDAEQLGVRILLPLGLCILPSFLAVGVLPMVLGMLAS